MSCQNFNNENCKDNTNELNIDQRIDDIDQLTCMTNTLLQSIASSCDINIDYSNFLACNQTKIQNTRLNEYSAIFIQKIAECKKIADPNFDANEFIQRATRAFKTLKFLIDSARGLDIPVKCDNEVQSNDGNCDPSKCTIKIGYRFNSQRFLNHKQLATAVCKLGSIMSGFSVGDFPPDFAEWYENIKNGAGIAPPYVYTLPNGWIKPQRPGQPLDCANILVPRHAILITGASCVTINGQDYIEYTFKDTYVNAHGQVIWTVRVPVNTNIPFDAGMQHPFGGGRITSATVVNCPKVKKDYEKCCTPTPTSTPTPTPTPQPSVTPTPTLTTTVTPTPTKDIIDLPPTPSPTPSNSPEIQFPTPTPSTYYAAPSSVFIIP
jgi:hypothetical protein